MSKFQDSNLEFTLTVNTKSIRIFCRLIYTILFCIGTISIFYANTSMVPGQVFLGMFMMGVALYGMLLSFYIIKRPLLVGILISISILSRSMALLMKAFQTNQSQVIASVNGALIWFLVWVLYYYYWLIFMQPYSKFRFDYLAIRQLKKKILQEDTGPLQISELHSLPESVER